MSQIDQVKPAKSFIEIYPMKPKGDFLEKEQNSF